MKSLIFEENKIKLECTPKEAEEISQCLVEATKKIHDLEFNVRMGYDKKDFIELANNILDAIKK